MTIEAQGPRQCARQAGRMTPEDEFLYLFDERRRIDQRLDELAATLSARNLPGAVLPKCGLRLAAGQPGSLLFKGGRA